MHTPTSTRADRQAAGARSDRAEGFTLMEILIAVAIVGIIAAIAIPSYGAYLTQTRRSDATIFLTEAAGEQVRYFSEFNAYTDDMTELGYDADSAVVTPDGLYQVSAVSDGATFTLTATPVPGKLQENDTDCSSFTLNSSGARGASSAHCW